jgi:hypothetical protein
MTDGGCVVIDLKSRRRETVKPSRPDPHEDRAVADRILHKLALILEQDLATLSPSSPDLPHLQRMLAAARRRAPADGSSGSDR